MTIYEQIYMLIKLLAHSYGAGSNQKHKMINNQSINWSQQFNQLKM